MASNDALETICKQGVEECILVTLPEEEAPPPRSFQILRTSEDSMQSARDLHRSGGRAHAQMLVADVPLVDAPGVVRLRDDCTARVRGQLQRRHLELRFDRVCVPKTTKRPAGLTKTPSTP